MALARGHYQHFDEIPASEWPWRHFSPWEVAQRGGAGAGSLIVVPEFIFKLDLLRDLFGGPLHVNSWYRDPQHNSRVSSTGLQGPHTTGRALDLRVSGADRVRLLEIALALGFTGFGFASTFTHLDDLQAPEYPRPNTWTY